MAYHPVSSNLQPIASMRFRWRFRSQDPTESKRLVSRHYYCNRRSNLLASRRPKLVKGQSRYEAQL